MLPPRQLQQLQQFAAAGAPGAAAAAAAAALLLRAAADVVVAASVAAVAGGAVVTTAGLRRRAQLAHRQIVGQRFTCLHEACPACGLRSQFRTHNRCYPMMLSRCSAPEQ